MITSELAGARNPVQGGTLSGQPTEAFMTIKLNLAASSLALALVLAANGASAQTVITRSITTEPVETVVTQGPSGTIVTRRPIDAPRAVAPIAQPALPATAVIET